MAESSKENLAHARRVVKKSAEKKVPATYAAADRAGVSVRS